MAISPPALVSLLSTPQQINNFIALQSAKITAGTATTAVTFTNIPSGNRVTFKISCVGTTGAYLSGGTASVAAVVSSVTPTPTEGAGVVSTCDYIGPGSILTQDYIGGTSTLAAITSSGTAVLEVSIGTGQ